MNLTAVFLVGQIVVSFLLIGTILLQAQGTGLGGTWAGGGESFHTKRGVERVMFALTLGLIVIFFLLSLLNVLFAS